MDSVQELRKWSARDIETLQEVGALKKNIRESEGEVVLSKKEIYTVDKLADYFMRHRNLKYLAELAGDYKCRTGN